MKVRLVDEGVLMIYKPRIPVFEAHRYTFGEKRARELVAWSNNYLHYTNDMEWDDVMHAYRCPNCRWHFYPKRPVADAIVVPRMRGKDQLCLPGDWIVREGRSYESFDDDSFHEQYEEAG